MANEFRKNFSMGTIKLEDGTAGTPLSHTMTMDTGEMTITGMVPGHRDATDYSRKGVYQSSAYTGFRPFSVTINADVHLFTDTSNGTITDMILGTAGSPYAARVSTLAPSGATTGKVPAGFTITLTIEGTDFGESADLETVMPKCRIDNFDFSEGDPDSFSLTFTGLGDPTGDLAISTA